MTVLEENGFLPGALGALGVFIGLEPKFPKLIFVFLLKLNEISDHQTGRYKRQKRERFIGLSFLDFVVD
jgi:hypothetical protein